MAATGAADAAAAALCAVAKKVGHSPALSWCSTTWPPSPLQLDGPHGGIRSLSPFSSSRSASSPSPSPSLENAPQLPVLSAAFLLPSSRCRAPDSDGDLPPCDEALVEKAECELLGPIFIRQSKSKGMLREDFREEHEPGSPTYYEEWQEFFRANRDSWVEGGELMKMALAKARSEEQALSVLPQDSKKDEEPSKTEVTHGCNGGDHSLQPLLLDEDGDHAHEFWVENRESGEMEHVDFVAKRSCGLWPTIPAGTIKRAKQ